MSQDISSFGLKIRIIASKTFPVGFTVDQAADDVDPFDLPSLQIADKAMGSNGDLIVWSKANPIIISVSVIPAGVDDKNLAILFNANRVGRGKNSASDIITLTGMYPDGSFITLDGGKITDGLPGKPVASSGRLKTKTYSFAFENISGAG